MIAERIIEVSAGSAGIGHRSGAALVAALIAVLAVGCATQTAVSTPGGGADGVADDRAVLRGTIAEVGGEYGNLDSTVPKASVEAAGISAGSTFDFTCNGTTVQVKMATTYSDVDKGDWVAFINWDDKLRVAISFGNAAEVLACKADDPVTVAI